MTDHGPHTIIAHSHQNCCTLLSHPHHSRTAEHGLAGALFISSCGKTPTRGYNPATCPPFLGFLPVKIIKRHLRPYPKTLMNNPENDWSAT